MITSYHNHTHWSDGHCGFEEHLQAARQLHLDELGFSDHYILAPGAPELTWSMPVSRLGEYVNELLALAGKSSSPRIRLGIEADFFPETAEELRAKLARYPFDYVIGSVHYVDSFCVDEAASFWEGLSEEEAREKWRLYWVRVRQMAESRVFDFAAHLDLPKKFGFFAPAELKPLALEALDALAANDMAIELNTAGWEVAAGEAYPSPGLLREACRRGIPLLINADAHYAAHLTRHFERARALAHEAGYRQFVRYEKRQRIAV